MKLLLHICFANCACYPVEQLRANNIDVTGFWYNHNIHPYREYRQRLESLMYYANHVGLPLIVEDVYNLFLCLFFIKLNLGRIGKYVSHLLNGLVL